MDNKDFGIQISPESWLDFINSPHYDYIMSIMESLRDENLKFSMGIADQNMLPDESIAAFVNRAKGIQIVIDDINHRTVVSKEQLRKESKVNGM